MSRWLTILLAVATVAFGSPFVTLAQEAPAASGAAGGYLLGPAAFGAGWSGARTAGLEVDTDVFRDGAVSTLVGPDGARVVLVALLVTEDRVAVRRSWEAAVAIYDNYAGELEHLDGRDDELDSEPPPAGCVEAKRIDGTARQLGIDTGIPMGVTLCAADADLIVLVVASGTVAGRSGYAASDAIASLMVAGGSVGTPVS